MRNQSLGVRAILARNIKMAREKLGISQQELAERAELSTGHVNDVEQARKWVSAESLEQLADALFLEPFMLLLPPDYSREGDAFTLLTEYAASVRESVDGALDRLLEQTQRRRGPAGGQGEPEGPSGAGPADQQPPSGEGPGKPGA